MSILSVTPQIIETFRAAGWTHMPESNVQGYPVFRRRARNIELEIITNCHGDGACCLCFAYSRYGEWLGSIGEAIEYANRLAETDLFGGWA